MDEQPLEAQQFIKGPQGKGLGSHEWTCRWCDWKVVATSITKLRHHIPGTSTQVRKCTSKGQAFVAVRDQLLGVQQQQLSAAAVRATAATAAAAAAVSTAAAAAGPTPAGRQGGLTQTSMLAGLQRMNNRLII